jgi:hypothetical protein
MDNEEEGEEIMMTIRVGRLGDNLYFDQVGQESIR